MSTLAQQNEDKRPKRPLTGYNRFFREERIKWIENARRKRAKGHSTGSSDGQSSYVAMGKEISQRWARLPQDTKNEYNSAYKRELVEYNQTLRFLHKEREKVLEDSSSISLLLDTEGAPAPLKSSSSRGPATSASNVLEMARVPFVHNQDEKNQNTFSQHLLNMLPTHMKQQHPPTSTLNAQHGFHDKTPAEARQFFVAQRASLTNNVETEIGYLSAAHQTTRTRNEKEAKRDDAIPSTSEGQCRLQAHFQHSILLGQLAPICHDDVAQKKLPQGSQQKGHKPEVVGGRGEVKQSVLRDLSSSTPHDVSSRTHIASLLPMLGATSSAPARISSDTVSHQLTAACCSTLDHIQGKLDFLLQNQDTPRAIERILLAQILHEVGLVRASIQLKEIPFSSNINDHSASI